ncbi:hypothetical protein OG195_44735 (plasmid) [Streptomyces sp. NBC_01362]|uniref:hypothetical protein n=1 Tax=Streptomyces sp. NBC_01362 TaxID=2903839 RepID=UPI002E35C659|nr:hypothetical protein [Streptomyces sp. NBC_01362]
MTTIPTTGHGRNQAGFRCGQYGCGTTTTETLTVNCFDVQLDNGENLKALAVGDYLNLTEPAAGMQAGTWQVVAYHGEFWDRATMRLVTAVTEEPGR